MARTTNKTKATTAGMLGTATAAWLTYHAAQKFGVPPEVAGEVISMAAGGIGAFVARWAAKLDPSK